MILIFRMIKSKLLLEYSRDQLRKSKKEGNHSNQITCGLQENCFFNYKLSIINRKPSDLPHIQSPFLKKAVLNLFSSNQSGTLAPIKRYNPQKQSPKVKELDALQCKGSLQKISKPKIDLQIDSMLMSQKMKLLGHKGKSFSESKNITQVQSRSNSIEQLQVSEQRIEAMRRKKGKKQKKQSTQSSNGSDSKDLYKRLKQLKVKDKLFLQNSKSLQRQSKKQLKASNFVMKHKITRQLYFSEKEEIKYVKTFFKNSDIKFDQSIKVKNYINFFPNVINIES